MAGLSLTVAVRIAGLSALSIPVLVLGLAYFEARVAPRLVGVMAGLPDVLKWMTGRRVRTPLLNTFATTLLSLTEALVPAGRREWFTDAWRDVLDEQPGWPRVAFALRVLGTSLLYRLDPAAAPVPPAPATARGQQVVVTVETPYGTVRVEVDPRER